MTNEELNQYIKHYIEKDQTGRAIMLSGDWGVGKSYYIKNELIPFLKEPENGEHQCIVVSLYGLSSLSEISRAIFFETKLKKLVESKALQNSFLAAKTVCKGITSYFGINLSASKEDLRELYESIDLSGKLIIIEDVERANIGILDILGYINSLAEQDKVKVLLVANEKEIIQYKPEELTEQEKKNVKDFREIGKAINKASKGSEEKEFTEETLRYLEVKEKSIGDTITFTGDLITAVKGIIETFDNERLKQFATDQVTTDVTEIMRAMKNENLRSVIFACQKTADIYEHIDDSFSEDFLKTVFYSIVAFSLRIHAGADRKWIGLEQYSHELGTANYPLFRFCYDYIMTQKLDMPLMPAAAACLEDLRLYDKHKTDSDTDIQTLCGYYLHTEKEVNDAVANITRRLNDPNNISFYDYCRIAVNLIIIKHNLGINIDDAKERLINNLKGRGDKLKEREIFWNTISDESEEKKREFIQLREDMIRSLNEGKGILSGFDYQPEQIALLFDDIVKDKNTSMYYDSRGFAKYFDIPRLVDMFFRCTPAQMYDLRSVFDSVYRPMNIGEFLSDDLPAIEELLATMEERQKQVNAEIDGVQRLHCEWFIQQLKTIKDKLQ